VISSKDDAKRKTFRSAPATIRRKSSHAEMVIQIIPLRHLDATAAARDLAAVARLLDDHGHADSNSLVVTDTNINLKQVVTLVNALDTSSDSVFDVKILQGEHADPMKWRNCSPISTRPSQNQQNATAAADRTRSRRWRSGGWFGPPRASAAAGPAEARCGGRGGGGGAEVVAAAVGVVVRRSRRHFEPLYSVVAVADPRTLSSSSPRRRTRCRTSRSMVAQSIRARPQTKVFVSRWRNANVKQVETTLKNLFPSSNTRTTTNTQADPLTARATANAQNTPATTFSWAPPRHRHRPGN